jgi:hypothetical protein
MKSKMFSLIKLDWKKIGIGAGVAVGGALLTYIAELVPTIDFWDWTPLVVALLGVLVNIGRKYLSETIYK